MYEDDFFGFTNNSSTTTETSQDTAGKTYEETPSYSSRPDTAADDYEYSDDYSVAPTYKGETGYNAARTQETSETESEQQTTFRAINAPIIQHREEAETVTLTKTKQVIRLSGRMKIVLSMFVVIMVSLIAAIAWNFARVGNLNNQISEKEQVVARLQASINGLSSEYNELGDDGTIHGKALDQGFVDADESNTVIVEVGETYTKPAPQQVPSNWFNDFCNFLSRIFG